MNKDYNTRLREFEAEKRQLAYKNLNPKIYQQKVQELARKYGI